MPYKDPNKRKIYHKTWHKKNRDEILLKQRKYRLDIKIKVLSHYCPGEIMCECCGERTLEFLAIDHIEGGGTKHRKKIGRGALYLWLIRNKFPDGYRVLCHNCNQAIGSYGKCPHKNL